MQRIPFCGAGMQSNTDLRDHRLKDALGNQFLMPTLQYVATCYRLNCCAKK